jgi:hypothetical protein
MKTGLPTGAAGRARGDEEVDWPALGCILLVALGVRLFLMTDALSYDEAQHFLVAKSPLVDDFVREFRLRAHPPLAYLSMKPFVALGASVYQVRMAALLCGLASIIAVYWLLLRTVRLRGAALVGTGLIALAPLFVKQSIEARHYSLCLLLVWASLLQWQRMRENDFKRNADHLVLAVLQGLALLAEYSAVFAVAALSLVVYAPLALRQVRRRSWQRIACWALPQVGVAAAVGWLFSWQFEGAVPSYTHTQAALYLHGGAGVGANGFGLSPSLLDVPAVAAFLWRQLGFFQNAILPAPFGLAVLAALLLAFAPWLRDDPRMRTCRAVALYALVSLGLTIAASLLGLFPFGGRPRHNAALVPGILLASYLGVVLGLNAQAGHPVLRKVVALSLIAIVALGIALGLRPGLEGREVYQALDQRSGAARYRRSPAPIVANWRGRIYASWWFLPDATPHETRTLPEEQVFDYGDVRVTESESPQIITSRAFREVKRSGEVWVLLSHFRDKRSAHLRGIVADVQREVARTDGVELIFAGEADFFPPLAVLQLRAVPPAR